MSSDHMMLEDGKPAQQNNLDGVKFTKEKDNVDVQPTTKLIGLTKEQLEQYRNDPFWKAIRYALFILFWLVWLAMFVGAILIVVLSPKCATKVEPKWHANAVVYQIFTPTFKDSDGDGVGDLNGIQEKLNDLRKIGVTAIWPTPILKTNKDLYSTEEVIDHTSVDPRYGTKEDLKMLVQKAHDSNIKFIVDLPLTVSSSEETFKKVVNATLGGVVGHNVMLLNVEKAEVQAKLLETAKMFLLIGVDGIHLTSYGLSKDVLKNPPSILIQKIREIVASDEELKKKEILIFTEGSENANEMSSESAEDYHILSLTEGEGSLIERLERNIQKGSESIHANGTIRPIWRAGNLHGQRIDQLLGNDPKLSEHKREVSALVTLIQLFLPGPVDVLYGEELTLPSAAPESQKSPQRVIQQWNSNKNEHFGFSKINDKLFFPVADKAENVSFESQYSDVLSPLKQFKRMTELRIRDTVFQQGDLSFDVKEGLHVYSRFIADSPTEYVYVLAVNWPIDGETAPRKLNLAKDLVRGRSKVEVKVPSAFNTANFHNQELNLEKGEIIVQPYQAIVLRLH